MSTNTINLLWTGGFDSTYRLLEILLVERQPVQTFYLIDTGRSSSITEVRAMESIKKALFERSPELRNMLLPTSIDLVSNIHPHPEITARYNRLAAQVRVGIQYEWLARFADEHQIYDLELCMTRLSAEQMAGLHELLHPELVGEGHACRLRDNLQDEDLCVFKYFRFPTIHVSKAEMEAQAKRYGYRDLLDLTWYCHSPTPDGKPCGTCRPCQIRNGSGLSHQVAKRPITKRAMSRIRRLIP